MSSKKDKTPFQVYEIENGEANILYEMYAQSGSSSQRDQDDRPDTVVINTTEIQSSFIPPTNTDLIYSASQPNEFAIVQETINQCQKERKQQKKQKKSKKKVKRRSKKDKQTMQTKANMKEPPGTKDDTISKFNHEKYSSDGLEIMFYNTKKEKDDWLPGDGDNIVSDESEENSEYENQKFDEMMDNARPQIESDTEDSSSDNDTSDSEYEDDSSINEYDMNSFIDDEGVEPPLLHKNQIPMEIESSEEKTEVDSKTSGIVEQKRASDTVTEKLDEEVKETEIKRHNTDKIIGRAESTKPRKSFVSTPSIMTFFEKLKKSGVLKPQQATRVIVNATPEQKDLYIKPETIEQYRLTEQEFNRHNNVYRILQNQYITMNKVNYQALRLID